MGIRDKLRQLVRKQVGRLRNNRSEIARLRSLAYAMLDGMNSQNMRASAAATNCVQICLPSSLPPEPDLTDYSNGSYEQYYMWYTVIYGIYHGDSDRRTAVQSCADATRVYDEYMAKYHPVTV